MNVYVTQIYIEPGVNFPFTCAFQRRMCNDLTKLVTPSEKFLKKYSEDFDIGFNVSAKAEIAEAEIKGPTVFKKAKDVEFTIFLPYHTGQYGTRESYRQPLLHFLESVVIVFERLGIDGSKVTEKSAEIVERILSDDTMFKNQ